MLSEAQIRRILEELSYTTVVEFDGYRVQKQAFGYSTDSTLGVIQAGLSIMLEVAHAREA